MRSVKSKNDAMFNSINVMKSTVNKVGDKGHSITATVSMRVSMSIEDPVNMWIVVQG